LSYENIALGFSDGDQSTRYNDLLDQSTMLPKRITNQRMLA